MVKIVNVKNKRKMKNLKYWASRVWLVLKYGSKISWEFLGYLFTNPSVLTKENMKAVLVGYYRYIFFDRLSETTKEIFLYRMEKRAADCVLNGKCPCNCETPFKQLDDRACERKCYPAMMPDVSWELYKKIYKIKDEDIRNYGKKYLSLLGN